MDEVLTIINMDNYFMEDSHGGIITDSKNKSLELESNIAIRVSDIETVQVYTYKE